MNTRVLGLLLIGLFLSLQAVGVLYQAYPQSELVKVQPSAFELDAIRFIDSNSPGRYVVLDDTGFASLAIGFLGVDYGYAGGSRGLFGIPEWSYPTMQMYNAMVSTPSIGIMQQAMNFAKAKLSYFVVSVRNPDFKEVVERTSEILPPYRVFGDDQLYVFMYPLPLFEETGPSVKVVFDGGNSTYAQTKLEYMVENEINATVTPLTGYSNYTVTEFPTNWTFLELTVNNITRPFDPQSDINTVISVSRLQPSDVLSIKWLFNRRYPRVGWKEDSFKDLDKWHAHDLYRGTMLPSIASDGNILSMSYSFTTGSYWYYYYVTSVNVSTNDYPYLLMRWRCDRPVAVASVYFESGGVHEAVPLGSISLEWSVIVVPLPSDAMVRTVMVGLTNAGKQQRVAGTGTMEVDYILMASGT